MPTDPDSVERKIWLRVKAMLGYEPDGLGDLLHILSHPDVIQLTREFLDEQESGE